jgi:hypothetical protein
VSALLLGTPHGVASEGVARDMLRDAYENRSTAPADGRSTTGSSDMFGQLHSELARQKHREACIEARRVRVLRAARAGRRARRALELAVRAGERADSGV